MKLPALLLSVIVCSGLLYGSPVSIGDPFPGSSCNSGCDVIGAVTDFDIQGLTADIGPTQTVLNIAFNFRDISLSQYKDFGVWLNVGDVLFSVNGVYEYGVALRSHAASPNDPALTSSTVIQGHLYHIEDASGILTARQALGNPGLIYRPDEMVWLRNYNGSLTDLASGSVQVNALGGNNAEYRATVTFATPTAFFNDVADPGVGVHFASATCANDIVDGFVQVPEPNTSLLIGAGLLSLGLVARRVRARQHMRK